jgi:mono/diheme cytochrome c family protein
LVNQDRFSHVETHDKLRDTVLFKVGAPLASLVAITAFLSAQSHPDGPQTGESMYRQTCAPCHDGGVERAPRRDALKAMSPERVLDAMETGEMVYMAARWPVAVHR